MKASDIAYLISLVDGDKANPELLKELQEIYRIAQGGKYGPQVRVPVRIEPSVMIIERS